MALSETQKREFVRNGFLVVDDAVSASVCEAARRSVWDAVDEAPDDPAALRAAESPGNFSNQNSGVNDLDDHLDAAPFEAMLEQVFPYAEALVGEGNLPAPGEDLPGVECLHSTAVNPVVRYPREDIDPADPNGAGPNPPVAENRNPHVDALDNHKPWTVIVVVLFDDVYPRSGGFTVWPGSHRLVADWFREHPVESIEPLPDELADRIGPGYEAAGSAGTAVLAHNKTLHSSGPVYGARPRLAAIANLSRRDVADHGEEFYTDLWRYWDGLDGIGAE
ncbi:MAG: phytanoyl-CoA dioxygenase family protein [Halobacteriaceae archaeon]